MSPILVTGATGFIGRHVMARAAEHGVEAVASTIDLREADTVHALVRDVRPDAIVHLASGPRSAIAIDDEVGMACNLLASAGSAAVLIAGSAAQYGMGSAGPLAEAAPTEPLTPYGAAKCAVERATMGVPDAQVIFARTFNVLGPGQPRDAPIPSWAAQLAAGATTLRTGNVDVVRDFLDVRDVADAFLDLVARGFAGVVNVGSGVPVTLRAVIDELVAQVGTAAEVRPDTELMRRQDPPHVVADVALLRRATGFTPRFALRDSLADVLAEWGERSTVDAR